MGPGGDFFADLTQSEPRPAQLAFYDELDTLLAFGISPAWREDETTPYADMVLLQGDGDAYFFSRQDDMFEAGMSVNLAWMGAAFVGHNDLYFFEGAVPFDYLLAPADAPDPRADLHGQRCGVLSRLRPGTRVKSPWQADEGLLTFYEPYGI